MYNLNMNVTINVRYKEVKKLSNELIKILSMNKGNGNMKKEYGDS